MKHAIHAIYDTASGLYRYPMFTESDGVAIRSFEDASINAESAIGKHPEDYTLFRIGSFDDNTGKLTYEDPSSLKTALACVAKSRNVNKDNLEKLDDTITDLKNYSPGGTA